MKKFWIIILSIIAALAIAFFCLPQYVRKALIHLTPNIDDLRLFPYNTVEASNPEDVTFHKDYNTAVIETTDRQKMEHLDPVAFVVFKDGQLLYEEYWDNYNDTSLSNIFSASKSVISLLIGIAIDNGFIGSEQDIITQYIPEFGDEYDYITIENLLTMSGGFDWEEGYNSLFNLTTEAYYGKDLKKLILSQKPSSRPGKNHYYSSGTTALLGLILKNATNMTISEFASKYLWTPIGAQYDAKWSLDHKDGMEKSYCCFYSNARDLARIGQLALQNGKWDGKQVVSKEYLEKAFTAADYLVDEDSYKVDYYGYQWWLLKYKYYNIKYARGIYGQYIITIPELNMVIVRLGNKRDDVKVGAHPKDVFLYIDVATKMISE
ncbi:MAG: serine hydrolase [Bacteroidales bacterium]|nr:serine hydrolase [Bacteroidales bacterium]MDD3152902.1 serine hydrolase [Bacteroidales bacterium]MDD3915262.1 serine hydrolase [Bacteroidales bacterium]MDD4634928.1 serine hydrolase [Bacteroidales bacterium]